MGTAIRQLTDSAMCGIFGHRWFYVAEYDDGLVLRGYFPMLGVHGIVALRRACQRCRRIERLPQPGAAAAFGTQHFEPHRMSSDAWEREVCA